MKLKLSSFECGLLVTLCFLPGFSLGQEKAEKDARAKLKSYPAAVQKTVDEQSKGASIRGLSKEVENGKTQYELELTVNGHNKDIRADRIRPLVDWVAQCFPGVSTQSVVPWAGLRPMMPDMLPRVGRGRSPCVFYNTGHGHLGWTLSAVTAEMIAGIVQQTFETPARRDLLRPIEA